MVAAMHFEPTADDLLPIITLLNARQPTYRTEFLPSVAAGVAAVWPEGLEYGIAGLDEFHSAIVQNHHIAWQKFKARQNVAEGLYTADHPVRLCTDMSCAAARELHGRIVPYGEIVRFPLPDCDLLGCRCSIMIHPRGVYRD